MKDAVESGTHPATMHSQVMIRDIVGQDTTTHQERDTIVIATEEITGRASTIPEVAEMIVDTDVATVATVAKKVAKVAKVPTVAKVAKVAKLAKVAKVAEMT
jgi:hypothetical protein